MNILTFDIEDWYNCDFISRDFEWDKWEYRVDKTLIPLLDELDRRRLKGTFFCLGWLADHHPDIIHEIARRGHQLGCHSYQHELTFRFTLDEFIADTLRAKQLIEDAAGVKVEAFRAPGFSIMKDNTWALEAVADMGFRYDCSMFPAHHDYGGMPSYGKGEPKLIRLSDGRTIKEFPINIHYLHNKPLLFYGGGFFRFFPYWLIHRWASQTNYMMTYFHPRDFDTGQPVVKGLPLQRRFKSYVGISGAMKKWKRLLDDFSFCNVEQADQQIDWNQAGTIDIEKLKA